MPGITYEALLDGKQGYTFKLLKLYSGDGDEEQPFTFRESVETLQKHTTAIMDEIVKNKKGDIEEFVIGKTFARQRVRGGKRQPFDPSDVKTWRLANGVNGRWNDEYKKRGYDGMVVLCAVTSKLLPGENTESAAFDQEHYSIALEQQLIQYFLFEKNDPRLANKSFFPGRLGTDKAYAGVVYLAFKREKPDTDIEE